MQKERSPFSDIKVFFCRAGKMPAARGGFQPPVFGRDRAGSVGFENSSNDLI